MSRSARVLIGLGGFRQGSRGLWDWIRRGSCAPCWLPGSTKDLTLYGGAATGSMTRYDERHENLIRPDFQYIIRVTKKVVTSTVSRRGETSTNNKKKIIIINQERSGSLRRLTIYSPLTPQLFKIVCAPVEVPSESPRPTYHLEATARDLVRFTLEKHGCPWPQTGSWTHGKNGYVDPLRTRERTYCHGPNNLRTRIGPQTKEREALQADKRIRDNFTKRAKFCPVLACFTGLYYWCKCKM